MSIIEIKRKHELELALEGVNLPKCYKDEVSENTRIQLLSYIMDTGLPVEEVNYLVKAYYMPYEDIKNDTEIYNSLDQAIQINFLVSLCKKYSAKPKTILNRIKEVNAINIYRKKSKQFVKGNK